MFGINLKGALDWALGRRVLEAVAEESNRRAAEYLMERAAYYIRVYGAVDTGRMLDSLGVIESSGGGQYHVVCTAPYAVWVEYGHLTRGGGTWVAPRPFMRNAFADTARAYPGIVQGVQWAAPTEGSGKHLGVSFDR